MTFISGACNKGRNRLTAGSTSQKFAVTTLVGVTNSVAKQLKHEQKIVNLTAKPHCLKMGSEGCGDNNS